MRPVWHRHTAPGHAPVLDIGGEVGALIVYLAGDTPSGELDIEPTGRPAARFHTGVHHRHVDGGDHAWVAVFPEVAQGAYDLLHDDGSPMATVAVAGGEVEQLDLR